MDLRVSAAPVGCFAALGEAWRALEAEAADFCFFRSWTWVGCLAEERYPDPWLLRAEANGKILGLALFNRRRGRLHLAASGDPALDAPFVEHNGPLLAASAGPEMARALLRTAWRSRSFGLVLDGVPPDVLAAVGGVPLRLLERPAPRVELDAVREAGGGFLATLSANTRQQLRRSARAYARQGELAVSRAADAAEAATWLDALIALHTESWRRRGEPGAFASPFLRRFHHALVGRAAARGELELLRVDAGTVTLGYLYNFRLHGHVHAYQSGFDYATAGGAGKPGLTCHHLAIERALTAGDRVYDFLAGAARYKQSLGNASRPLFWAELLPDLPGLRPALRLARVLRERMERRGAEGVRGSCSPGSGSGLARHSFIPADDCRLRGEGLAG